MAQSVLSQIRIAGIASAVPAKRQGESDLASVFGEKEARRLVKGTGVVERRIDPELCTSDLCFAAAERLIEDLGWSRDSIQHLVFLSQTPDYRLPATACVLQHRLGLSTECTAFDVNLGCSGYTYGIWLAGKLLEPGQRALLCVGDMASCTVSSVDRSALPLFGDAVSVTALECTSEEPVGRITFFGGTDGSGHDNIIIPAGGYRVRTSLESLQVAECSDGIFRTQENLLMKGAEVFSFGIREVPNLIKRTLDAVSWQISDVDAFVFHQANTFMLTTIADKLGISMDRVPLSIERFGNTSSASIPLTLTVCLRDSLQVGGKKLLLVGFGVGWSWAALALQPGPIIMPELIEL
jgi:3-oxoacyl-[acyl-carrier-protein] synthase-3